jgi:hypothetical protein
MMREAIITKYQRLLYSTHKSAMENKPTNPRITRPKPILTALDMVSSQ